MGRVQGKGGGGRMTGVGKGKECIERWGCRETWRDEESSCTRIYEDKLHLKKPCDPILIRYSYIMDEAVEG